jgi:3-oxoacyl-[acyl-carrier protein] reductase
MKYALITGGSRGIGRAISETLAREKIYGIIINYQNNKIAAEETKQMCEKWGVKVDLLPFNVADKAAVEKAVSEWQVNHPDDNIEILVNNAGITRDGLFMWLNENDWDSVVNTSLKGFYNVTQSVIQSMLHKRYGRIINIVSVSGVKGTAGQTNYSAAKGAIVAATKALSQEVAKRNITVNAVAPGFIKTEMTEGLNEKELVRLIPCNRFGEAQEVADLVAFLCSKKAGYITGETININGGIYA